MFAKKTLWWPTWRGWLLLGLVAVGIGWLVFGHVHSFLSVTHRVPASVLVVEGWQPDYMLEQALQEFRDGGYAYLCTSGGPIEKGTLLSGYHSWAEAAGATLLKLGLARSNLIVAPGPKTYRHRTYVSAEGVRRRLKADHIEVSGVNVLSEGVHARRTWIVFKKVLGPDVPVGIISIPSQEYDPDRWWASSAGAKATLTEAIGWLYESWFDSGRTAEDIPTVRMGSNTLAVSGVTNLQVTSNPGRAQSNPAPVPAGR